MNNSTRWILGSIIGIVIGSVACCLLKWCCSSVPATNGGTSHIPISCDKWYDSRKDPTMFTNEISLEAIISGRDIKSVLAVETTKTSNSSGNGSFLLNLTLKQRNGETLSDIDYRFIGIPHHPIHVFDHDCAPAAGFIEFFKTPPSVAGVSSSMNIDKFATRTYEIKIPLKEMPNGVSAIWMFSAESDTHSGSGGGLRHGMPHPIGNPNKI